MFEERKVGGAEVISPQNTTAGIPEGILSGKYKRGLIKIEVEGRMIEFSGATAVGPLAADAIVRNITRNGRRVGHTAAKIQNALQLPSSEDSVAKRAGITQHAFSLF